MPRERLLVLASTFPAHPGDGTPGFVQDLARQEAEHFDVTVVVPSVPGGARREVAGAVTVERFRYFPRRWEDLAHGAILDNLRAKRSRLLQVGPFLAAEAWATFRAVRRTRPDAIHAHWIIPQGVVARCVAPRVPLLITTLGGDLYALNSAPLRALKRSVVRRAKAVTVMSEDMRQRVIALGAQPDAVHIMPMGADLASFSAPRPAAPAGPAGPVRILFVGRLVEKKGVPILADALRALPLDAAWRLTVVGDGPLRADLATALEGLPVTFAGQLGRDALASEYANADIVVFPSIRAASGDQDGLPVALLEAMGSGCAVIASDLPGINEAIADGVSGVLVPPGQAEPLRAALADLLADAGRRAGLGEAARAAAQRFDVTVVSDAYAELLHGLVSKR